MIQKAKFRSEIINKTMKYHYEGSTAQIGTEDWTEPCDAFASTPEIAAQQVVEWSLKCDVIESSEAVNIGAVAIVAPLLFSKPRKLPDEEHP